MIRINISLRMKNGLIIANPETFPPKMREEIMDYFTQRNEDYIYTLLEKK